MFIILTMLLVRNDKSAHLEVVKKEKWEQEKEEQSFFGGVMSGAISHYERVCVWLPLPNNHLSPELQMVSHNLLSIDASPSKLVNIFMQIKVINLLKIIFF